MTMRSQLIQKMYYETFMETNQGYHPIQVLGEAYMIEQQNELPDLSYIRFAQGEVYFHHKDYEAAIFKWENINNELEPWAKKNTADAYYELGILSTAEDIYQSIVSENPTLNTEVGLHLFSLYIERGKKDAAVNVIKKMVDLNPDYPNVTGLARAFFEEQQDWNNAVWLAVNEGIRTESLTWFDHVKTYIDQGVTKTFSPSYFSEALLVLSRLDQPCFEELVSSIWNSFKSEDTYLTWLNEINQLFINLEPNENHSWQKLFGIFKETYLDLIDGKHLIKKIQHLIPTLLSNWLRIAENKEALSAATAVLSWNDLFPANINPIVVEDAEAIFRNVTKNKDVLNDCLHLFDSIIKWAQEAFDFSSQFDISDQLSELNDFILSIENTREFEENRVAELLDYIRTTITNLLQKRIDVENQLKESVKWNEDMVVKLNGAVNQLQDLELQKTKDITRSYRSIKEAIQKDMLEVLPTLLRDCSKLISEDSNFSKIHVELNAEMNRRIQDYLENKVMPNYYSSLQDWIYQSKEVIGQGQTFLDEMSEGFNALFGEERIKLECDLKTLDDWRRDTDRMTCGFLLDDVNILLRKTPSQLLLKSAGKLFGALSQNKSMLNNKYKSFVENEDYTEAIEFVMNRFFQQFELFERSLERDMSWIFRNPLNVLNQSIEDGRVEIQINEEMLKKMNTNPEMFHDPLTLFEVRLRQLEWISLSGEA
jgi:tetratricopeptide (TPR) repeat protein